MINSRLATRAISVHCLSRPKASADTHTHSCLSEATPLSKSRTIDWSPQLVRSYSLPDSMPALGVAHRQLSGLGPAGRVIKRRSSRPNVSVRPFRATPTRHSRSATSNCRREARSGKLKVRRYFCIHIRFRIGSAFNRLIPTIFADSNPKSRGLSLWL